MTQLLDARGLACPLPAIKARAALAALPPGETLIVLATDPEAPVDIGALASDAGRAFRAEREGAAWRLTLAEASGQPHPAPRRTRYCIDTD
jgi:tRNA 2-thiouridine synthesizing protein A